MPTTPTNTQLCAHAKTFTPRNKTFSFTNRSQTSPERARPEQIHSPPAQSSFNPHLALFQNLAPHEQYAALQSYFMTSQQQQHPTKVYSPPHGFYSPPHHQHHYHEPKNSGHVTSLPQNNNSANSAFQKHQLASIQEEATGTAGPNGNHNNAAANNTNKQKKKKNGKKRSPKKKSPKLTPAGAQQAKSGMPPLHPRLVSSEATGEKKEKKARTERKQIPQEIGDVYIDSHLHGDDYDFVLLPGTANAMRGARVLCRYGRDCYSKTCRFHHSTLRRIDDPSPQPEDFIPCRFGETCRNRATTCPYSHRPPSTTGSSGQVAAVVSSSSPLMMNKAANLTSRS